MQVLVKNTFYCKFRLQVGDETVIETLRLRAGGDRDEWRVVADWATTDQGSIDRVIRLEKRERGEWNVEGEYSPEQCRINGDPALRAPTVDEVKSVRQIFFSCEELAESVQATLLTMGLRTRRDKEDGDIFYVWREDWAEPVRHDTLKF